MVRVRLLGLVVVLRRPGRVARVPGVARVRRYPGQRVSLLTAWRTTIARPASSLATGTRNGEHET